MSNLKKALHGEKYRNIGNELGIKSLEKKFNKLKGEYLLRYRDSTAEDLERFIESEVAKRRQATIQICKEAKYKKEIEIRKKKEEINKNQLNESKFILKRNYKVAHEQSLEQHLKALELHQRVNILKGALM